MQIRFMDLSVVGSERAGILEAINRVFDHGIFINGVELESFEREFAEYHNRSFASGVSSGTVSLYYALKTLGIGSGDEVITTALSWIATANAIVATGATPVFADINWDLNIDPASIERLITPRTKAIMPVHYAGRVCFMDEIMQIAQKYNLFVVEDASQAVGARRDGRLAGCYGDIAGFSLNPMKVLGALGEGGGGFYMIKETSRNA